MGLTANVIPVQGVNRTSQIVTSVVPAGEFLNIFQAGARFYLIVATGLLSIKPNNGSENEYVQGTGLECEEQNYFANIQVKNNTPNSIVFQIFVGFGSYIDNRLIVFDPSVTRVVYPTYTNVNTLGTVLIPDRSGQAIVDANGNPYLALNREAIYLSNLDTGVTYTVQDTALTKALMYVFPQNSNVLPWNGDFAVHVPAAFINMVISEVYNAILPT